MYKVSLKLYQIFQLDKSIRLFAYDKPERHGNHYSCNHFLVELLFHIPDETHGGKVPENHRTTDSSAVVASDAI